MSEVLIDRDAEEQVATLILGKPSDCITPGFHPALLSDEKLRSVCKATQALFSDGTEVTPHAVGVHLNAPEIGVLCEKLLTREIRPGSMEFLLRRLRDLAIRRRAAGTCRSFYDKLHEDLETPADELVDGLESKVMQVRSVTSGNLQPVGNMTDVIELLEWRAENPGKIRGMATGFPRLDKKMDGLIGGNLVVVAARPSIGKSSLMGNWICHQCGILGKKAVVHTLETTATEFKQRLVAQISGVSPSISLERQFTRDEIQKLLDAAGTISKWSLWIDDTPKTSIDIWRSQIRRLQRQHGIEIAYVDQLNLMRGQKGLESRRLEINSITSGMKSLAKELDIPVVLLAQLSRGNPRWDKDLKKHINTPVLENLKESGSIEEDSDKVIMIDRDIEDGYGSLVVGKARDARTGRVDIEFDGPTFTYKEDEAV